MNAVGQLNILKYRVIDSETLDDRGRKSYARSYLYMGHEIPDNLEERINSLKLEGFISVNRFQACDFDVWSLNPLIMAKIRLLGRNHKLLEKLYEEVFINDTCYIEASITYINVNTGKISRMKTGNLGKYSKNLVNYLGEIGYMPASQSFLNQNEERQEGFRR